MKKIYSTIVKDLGPMAEDFIGEKMIILFNENAPAELAEFCVLHTGNELTDTVEVGDILKINDGATVELSNGNSGSVLHVDKHYKTIQFAKEEKHWGALGIFILKGATVTQKRGEV